MYDEDDEEDDEGALEEEEEEEEEEEYVPHPDCQSTIIFTNRPTGGMYILHIHTMHLVLCVCVCVCVCVGMCVGMLYSLGLYSISFLRICSWRVSGWTHWTDQHQLRKRLHCHNNRGLLQVCASI